MQQANTKQTRKLFRAAVQRSIANYKQDVKITRTLTELSRANNAVRYVDARRYVVFMLQACSAAQLYDVRDLAQYLFANEGNNFCNKITLTGVWERNGVAYGYLRGVAHMQR
jgi:hypothetical protein